VTVPACDSSTTVPAGVKPAWIVVPITSVRSLSDAVEVT